MVNSVASIPVQGLALHADRPAYGDPERQLVLPRFVAGMENLLAVAAVRSLLESRRVRFSPLVLYGRTGVGKSHLAHGLARHWRNDGGQATSLVTTTRQFTQQLHVAIQADSVTRFRARYRCTALLVLEGIDGLTANSVVVQQELIHTLNALDDAGSMVVMTSRVPIRAITGLHPLIASRLTAGLALQLSPPTEPARLEILRCLTIRLGISISDRDLRVLANTVSGTVPELLRPLLQLSQRVPSHGPTAAADILRSRFADPATPKTLDMPRITTATARHFSLKPMQIRGPSRQRSVVLARGIAVYLTRRLTSHSYHAIGQFLGGRDHTTVLYNYRKIERLQQTDAATRTTIARLRCLLTSNDH